MVSSIHWIEMAREYAIEHPAIIEDSVTENKGNSFIATFRIFLPGKYDIIGEAEKGVKKEEPVTFVFPKEFPLKAPEIYLRDDFNRNFPHINPSIEKVKPCIYEGDLSELLQQPKWFDHILDQMSDWLDKASLDNLINPKQGWEPMRQDDLNGLHIDKLHELKEHFNKTDNIKVNKVWYRKINNLIISKNIGDIDNLKREDNSLMIYFSTVFNKVRKKYVVKNINNFSNLREFAEKSEVFDFAKTVNKYYAKHKKSIIFVSLNLRRPLNLINSNSNIETLFYAIEVIERKKNRKIHQQSKVIMLTALYDCESDLYRQMSGVKSQKIKNIIQIGSGSLGSKINLHLARNGTQGFSIIDNKYLTPHNNARHALFGNNFIQKSKFQANVLNNIGIKAKSYKADIRDKASIINNNSLIIDSTASISVRNFLTNKDIKGSIIHTALYDNSKLAFLLVESNDRNPRIDDLMCCIYNACLFDKELAYSFFSKQNILSSIGQGCGSYTTICPDSRISLCASGMASKIQKYISNGIVEKGEINIGVVAEDDMSINWRYIHCKKVHILQARNEDEFDVRIFETVSSKMKDISEEYSPKEYGGVLIGNISLINRTMTVTDILEAPEDSKFSKTLFEIGKRGLRKKVKDVEKKTNGLLTYLGTWHSHPFGGEASKIDKDTKVKILILRDYEPTVCLIWTPNRIIRV